MVFVDDEESPNLKPKAVLDSVAGVTPNLKPEPELTPEPNIPPPNPVEGLAFVPGLAVSQQTQFSLSASL